MSWEVSALLTQKTHLPRPRRFPMLPAFKCVRRASRYSTELGLEVLRPYGAGRIIVEGHTGAVVLTSAESPMAPEEARLSHACALDGVCRDYHHATDASLNFSAVSHSPCTTPHA